MSQVKNGFISIRWSVEEHQAAAKDIDLLLKTLYKLASNGTRDYGPNHKISLQSHQIVKRVGKLKEAINEQFWYEHPKETISPYGED